MECLLGNVDLSTGYTCLEVRKENQAEDNTFSLKYMIILARGQDEITKTTHKCGRGLNIELWDTASFLTSWNNKSESAKETKNK